MSAARNAAQAFLITVFVGGLLGPLYAMGSLMAGSDPWLGAHAAYTCPTICPGCHGPYESRGGTQVNGSSRRGRASKFYCQPPHGTLDDVDDLARYEFPDGSLVVIGASYAVVLPLVFAAAFGALRLLARRRKGPSATDR
ncbi:MAG: hypothetical protein Q8S73_16030 [Deltaproteobacteria bacterium]|nr:hypothetical protein [Myxococcales bacterium]MDP3215616.1 hypothetical protein [Deltaproteobacteria bacterium]